MGTHSQLSAFTTASTETSFLRLVLWLVLYLVVPSAVVIGSAATNPRTKDTQSVPSTSSGEFVFDFKSGRDRKSRRATTTTTMSPVTQAFRKPYPDSIGMPKAITRTVCDVRFEPAVTHELSKVAFESGLVW
jgi:hypothetical protein